MDKRIHAFLRGQTCATICCTGPEGEPWCFNAFYAFDETNRLLYLKSSDDTRHGVWMKPGSRVAGTILPDRLRLLAIRGLQWEGCRLDETDTLARAAYARYHRRFPFSIAHPGGVWTIRLDTLKYTDNTLGFGKKLFWKRGEE